MRRCIGCKLVPLNSLRLKIQVLRIFLNYVAGFIVSMMLYSMLLLMRILLAVQDFRVDICLMGSCVFFTQRFLRSQVRGIDGKSLSI